MLNFNVKHLIATMEQHKAEVDKRLSESAKTLGQLTREQVDALRSEFLIMRGNANLRRAVDERLREIALVNALKTPGVSGHDDVLTAARAYEQYLFGEKIEAPAAH